MQHIDQFLADLELDEDDTLIYTENNIEVVWCAMDSNYSVFMYAETPIAVVDLGCWTLRMMVSDSLHNCPHVYLGKMTKFEFTGEWTQTLFPVRLTELQEIIDGL